MQQVKRVHRALITLLIILFIVSLVPGATRAEPTMPAAWNKQPSEEEKQLLQQSLSITELDKEIERISARESEAAASRKQIESEILKQEAAFGNKREQAGRVLRAYYIGERDMMLQAIMSADELDDLFMLLDYFQLLFYSDQEILEEYSNQLTKLNQLRRSLAQTEHELTEVRKRLVDQRARLITLREKFDTNLADSSDPQAMSRLIQEFTTYWKNVGLFEVRHYFRALADAMQKLPDFVQKSGSISMNGKTYTITIQEEQLNQFLREQDPIFEQFFFRFKEGVIAAEGERSGLSVHIEGRYTLEAEPENRILFHVDQMLFNGLELPDTTRQDLEQEFDLGFYPQKLVSFLEATDVAITDKQITVQLTVKW
ncbi:hypothetical protein M3650_00015 [Paenibacillus sp. MER TA 81-3]|uniref:hypothetical protein n=1 Tax=Paenibacillus sp. MER TA 81-3 TaxID=2939573 RepID=UPI00203B28F9|nr:hypothetical protein [Paenibacillus sp. MER TA 81-3]MCM3337066.1 hypothetical protein [Paenibacillus sp. MER TA 81-3]